MAIVLLPLDLVVEGVERDASGNITYAHVVNGGWWLQIKDGVCYCKREKLSSYYVNSFPVPKNLKEVTVRGEHYNDVIERAYDQAARNI